MSAKFASFLVALVFSAQAYGQTQDRTLYFNHTGTEQAVQEIATLIRAMTEMPQLSVDTTKKSLALRGSPGQIELAEWLFDELDRPASRPPAPGSREYRIAGEGAGDVVRVFYLTPALTSQSLQEVATLGRSIADIRRVFTYLSPRAIVLRGASSQAAMADWIFSKLDPPPAVRPEGRFEYRSPASSDDVVRVFYLTPTRTPQTLQEVATLVRSMADIRRLFIYNGPKVIVLRGTASQAGMAEWLVSKLDQPPNAESAKTHEYSVPGSSDDLMRLFYLPPAISMQSLQEAATAIRTASGARRFFTLSTPRTMALRGTAHEVAVAERMVKERFPPESPTAAR